MFTVWQCSAPFLRGKATTKCVCSIEPNTKVAHASSIFCATFCSSLTCRRSKTHTKIFETFPLSRSTSFLAPGKEREQNGFRNHFLEITETELLHKSDRASPAPSMYHIYEYLSPSPSYLRGYQPMSHSYPCTALSSKHLSPYRRSHSAL